MHGRGNKRFFFNASRLTKWCMTSSKNSSTVLVSQFSEWVRAAATAHSQQRGFNHKLYLLLFNKQQITFNITFVHLHLCLFVCKIRDGEEWLKWRNGLEKLIDGSESAADGWCEPE